MVCPVCGRCNSRTKWDEWKCNTDGCQLEIPIRYHVILRSELAPDHAFEAEGHSIPFDKCQDPIIRTKAAFRGWWRELTFEISPGNFVTHLITNRVINRQPGGADEILESLQGEKLGLQRFPMKSWKHRCTLQFEVPIQYHMVLRCELAPDHTFLPYPTRFKARKSSQQMKSVKRGDAMFCSYAGPGSRKKQSASSQSAPSMDLCLRLEH